ncbi:hypothetical protein D3C80_1005330 [compost metagenome]
MIVCLLRQSLKCLGCSQPEGGKRFGKTIEVFTGSRSTVPHAIQVDVVKLNDHRTVEHLGTEPKSGFINVDRARHNKISGDNQCVRNVNIGGILAVLPYETGFRFCVTMQGNWLLADCSIRLVSPTLGARQPIAEIMLDTR